MSNAAGSASLQSDPMPIDVRAKIIGILSDTANGCLTELGYFPGLLKKLQELEQINAHWKKENVKLFQDNQTLAQLARYHEDRWKQANLSPKVASLEEQVKSLTIQNAELKKKNEALLASGSSQCSHVPCRQLLADYQQLTVLYRTAITEIHHLRQVIQVNAGSRPDSHSAFSTTHLMRSADPRLLQEQHMHPMQGLNKGQLANQVIPPLIPGGPPPVADPRNAAYPGHQYIPTPIPHSVNHEIASSIRPAPGMPNTIQGPLRQPYSIPNPMSQQMTHSTHAITASSSGIHAPFRHPSLTIKTSNPIIPSDTGFSPSTDARNVQNILPGSPPSVISLISYLPTARRSSQVFVSASRPPTRPPSQAATPSLSPAVTRTSTSNTPIVDFASYKSLSPPESARIPTPVSSALETSAVRVATSPLLGTDQLKRVRERIDEGLTDDLGSDKKRSRLDEDNLVSPTIDNAEKESFSNDAEDSDQEIEMDADGLRSLASCISELVETRAEDPEVQMCRLCDIRHRNGLVSEVPKPFLRVTQDDLVRHMAAEHAEAWETLRRDV